MNFGNGFGSQQVRDKAIQDQIEGALTPFSGGATSPGNPSNAFNVSPLPDQMLPDTFGFPGNAVGQTPTAVQSPIHSQVISNQIPMTDSTPQIPALGYPGEPIYSDGVTPEAMPVGMMSPAHWGVNSTRPENPTHDPYVATPVVLPNENGQASTESTTFEQSLVWGSENQQPVFDPTVSIQNNVYQQSIEPSTFGLNEGFKDSYPTTRGQPLDDFGEAYDFETKKKEFPPFSEIMKTGRYFMRAELMYLKPHFQNNTALTLEGLNTGQSQPFDFGYDAGSRFHAGFESKYGPGGQLNYFQYDHQSRPATFTSNGIISGETSTWMMGPSRWSRLRAENAGETITSEHSLEVQNLGLTFYKDWKLPVSKLGGGFGFQYVSIFQDLQSRVTDAGGNEVGTLSANHDFRAFGPKFEFNYYRPVGHTKIEMIGGLSGAVLFGNRDQFVSNTATGDFSRIGADEFMMIIDVVGGAQWVHHYADNRSIYARLTLMSQAWIGGGTALLPQDDFGFRGIGFGVGFNR